MAETTPKPVSADEARRVAEEARETEWKAPSFLRQIFLGNFRLDLVHPFPAAPPERPEFRAFMDRLERFLVEKVDPDAIDREGKIPPAVVKGLAEHRRLRHEDPDGVRRPRASRSASTARR